MKTYNNGLQRSLLLAGFLWSVLCLALSSTVYAEDIDIFAGTKTVNTNLPSVTFVLDNTSNWSRSSQKWPGSIVQGQAEVKAIKTALAAQVGKLNVGIMEYVTSGSSATTDSAYTRFNLEELTAARLVKLNGVLDTIYGNINGTTEKRSSSNPYGYLPNDYYNYLAGNNQSKNGAGTPTGTMPAPGGDPAAYTTQWSKFKSPLAAKDLCANTYMIFIGNNANGNVTGDDTTNTNNLKALYTAVGVTPPDALAGDSGTPLKMPGFTTTTVNVPAVVVPPVVQAGAWIPKVVITPAVPEQFVPAVFHPAVVKVVTQAYVAAIVVPPVMSAAVPITAATGISKSCWKPSSVSGCPADENTTGGLCAGNASGLGLCTCPSQNASSSGCSSGNRRYNVTRIAGTKPPVVITAGYTIPAVPEICGPCANVAAYTDPAYTIPAQPEVIQAGTGVFGPDIIITPGYTIPATTADVVTASGTFNTTGGTPYNFDDWTKFMNSYGIPVTVTVDGAPVTQRVKVITYVIDVFNAQQSADLSSVWFSAANNGGGRYFQAKSDDQILAAINSALGDIIAASSSFAAVSLPLSSTNRARVDNQVYVGMFRPAPGKSPRWFGNMKRYQLALFNGQPELADVNLRQAINSASGFVRECASSFWTHDSSAYWQNLGVDPSPLREACDEFTVTTSVWSDAPDGPLVEKGGVAQMTREGPVAASRVIKTVGGSTLRDLAASDATALGGTTVYNYLRGSVQGTNETMPSAGLRASIHGDVVHSRPLAIRFTPSVVSLYYGSNDGLYRAVNPSTGAERWALAAPEHFGKIARLYNDSPLVDYTGASQIPGYSYARKDYFFDGATGANLTYKTVQIDGKDVEVVDKAYIYPTQRRGGRMVYALDVSDPAVAPTLLWRQGCPNLANDTGCTTGFSGIGQTWSVPIGGYVSGYLDGAGETKLAMIFGGGFDDCLNADVAAYPTSACSAAKGTGVYVVDATTGAKLALLATDAPVVTEVATIDINFDGSIDFAYAADVKGSLYRVNFVSMTDSNPGNPLTALTPANWTIVKIGSMADNKRRFYNAPVAAAFKGTVVVSIGSGDRERPLEANYPFASSVQNRFYALLDRPYKTFVANPVGPLAATEVTTVNLDGSTMLAVVASADPDAALNEDTSSGWYMDVPDRGEQVANAAAIAGGKVFFNTFQPGGASNGVCERPLGIGTGYAVNLFAPVLTTGDEIEGGGMPIPPVIATVKMPPGCSTSSCPAVDPDVDPCAASSDCEIRTVCIGCQGFEPVEIIPTAPPIRQRVYFTEDIDKQ